MYSRTADGNVLARIEGLVNGVLRSAEFPLARVDCTGHSKPGK
jgi:hypothetical protein